ncbi:MAG: tRNA 2-thiocytidine(32) synthetase TtcA [Myxococcota bacterium]
MKRQISHLERSLYRKTLQAVKDYKLLEPNDRIMVCLSGGKDSYAMMHFLDVLSRRSPFRFELIAVHLDQVQPGYDGRPLEDWLKQRGFAYRILQKDTYSVVTAKTQPGQAYCFMCSRMRRGILYDAAVELGCTKIALGHHRDDALETLMLNLIFSGQLKSMPPKLCSDDGRNVVIRPLIYCAESDLEQFALEQQFPILPCNLCGSQENLQRDQMRVLLDQLEAAQPGTRTRMLAALCNVRSSHLLDQGLWTRLRLPGLAEGVPHVPVASPTLPPSQDVKVISATPGLERSATSEPESFEVGVDDDDDSEYGGGEAFSSEPIPVRIHDALGLVE